ncbi:DUF3558 domain-containing protein [Sphingomonas sp. LM7]|uniref:DUF3558 domain-containing protein n=1 Tax=Sphingomonas sp. LM7 TaxID=1938607 RepID=UPI000983ABC0|nr:DUF3558 domain-containing protein [Sphingomonas sp. LM7]AQR73558.1 hypothetical protein BXU08_07810 [Sphingomonas sp. LM7]
MIMRHAMTMCTAVVVAGLALAGCGGRQTAENGETAVAGGGAAGGGHDIDPCTLITPREMTAITTDKVTGTNRDGVSCTYRSEPNDGVQITVRATGGAKAMEVVHRSAELLGGMGGTVADKGGAGADVAEMLKKDTGAVPALGDEAVWGPNDTLSVRKGDAFVEVTPPLMHDPANHSGYPLIRKEEKRAIAQAVAVKLIEKLPR